MGLAQDSAIVSAKPRKPPPAPMKLHARDLEVFLAHARVADQWLGTPPAQIETFNPLDLVERLKRLEKMGYVELTKTTRFAWVHFTYKGVALADKHGVNVLTESAPTRAVDDRGRST